MSHLASLYQRWEEWAADVARLMPRTRLCGSVHPTLPSWVIGLLQCWTRPRCNWRPNRLAPSEARAFSDGIHGLRTSQR